ncbi:MAG: DPP IV N-terminal domain-containing protein [Crocinitomicaceae bacterium]|nr:DPP IV N-terminal domain-containing protein [Crocinitomicaceae bacterium]
MKVLNSILTLAFLVSGFTLAQKELTNELIWYSGEFSSDYVYSVSSMNDGEHFTQVEDNKIVKYSYKNFDEPVGDILNGKDYDLNISSYSFNADETKVLVETDVKSIYRYSYTAEYYIVDLKANKSTKLYDKAPQMLADFSPDGSKVAFISENNLYYKDLTSEAITQITDDGEVNKIINGTTDWVYEEEFGITKGFYWSPEGTKIAYMRFDESEVKEFVMDYYYGGTYPEKYKFKYPKAGEDNSKLSLNIYSLQSQKTIVVDRGPFEYVPRMKWTNDDNTLVYLALNRHQNNLTYASVTVDGENQTGAIMYQDRSDTYVDVDDNLIFLKDGNTFIKTSEKDGYNHIYAIAFDGAETQITKGDWDVVELLGIDEKKDIIYYISAEEGAMYKTLYSIKKDGSGKKKLSERLGSNSVSFSKGMKYYMNFYSNANEPYEISVHQASGKKISTLVDNAALKKVLEGYNLSKKEFITIKGAEYDLNAFIIKPPNFDESKKYPVYFNIYNGPGHNTVTDSWGGSNHLYHQLLAQKGYIVISVDTRGTMYRGAKFKKSTYLQLGKLETEDMIAVAKEVQAWPYVDPERIGVMGWSYGGYMSSLCMTKGADVFSMGIAVAPVTNWRWYDNIYTERFMRTPAENAAGYDDNSPINHVKKMKGKYMIIHGTGDDNVHAQHAYEMTSELVKENKEFDMYMYTNKNHGIYGGKTRLHLFNIMLNYTLENL